MWSGFKSSVINVYLTRPRILWKIVNTVGSGGVQNFPLVGYETRLSQFSSHCDSLHYPPRTLTIRLLLIFSLSTSGLLNSHVHRQTLSLVINVNMYLCQHISTYWDYHLPSVSSNPAGEFITCWQLLFPHLMVHQKSMGAFLPNTRR